MCFLVPHDELHMGYLHPLEWPKIVPCPLNVLTHDMNILKARAVLLAHSTCGSWCISGSICGLRKGNRHTLSPRLRRYSSPLAMRRTLSCTTSLLIIAAAVSRRVSFRTLSVGWQETQLTWIMCSPTKKMAVLLNYLLWRSQKWRWMNAATYLTRV